MTDAHPVFSSKLVVPDYRKVLNLAPPSRYNLHHAYHYALVQYHNCSHLVRTFHVLDPEFISALPSPGLSDSVDVVPSSVGFRTNFQRSLACNCQVGNHTHDTA